MAEEWKEFQRVFEDTRDKNEFIVYKDIKEKGFYITSGFKYGADFLLYRDDPKFVHSEFILFVFDSLTRINVKSLINGERLAISTKKKFLSAFVNKNENNFEVKYLNFEWLNI